MSAQDLEKIVEALKQAIKDEDLQEKSSAESMNPFHNATRKAKAEYQKAFLKRLMSKEVLSEIVWNLKLGTSRNGMKGIELIMSNCENKFYKLIKQYIELDGPLFLEFQSFTVNEKPKIYLSYSGFHFSTLASIDEQIEFLKENEIHFDTSLGWKKPEGFKKILKRLDNLYN